MKEKIKNISNALILLLALIASWLAGAFIGKIAYPVIFILFIVYFLAYFFTREFLSKRLVNERFRSRIVWLSLVAWIFPILGAVFSGMAMALEVSLKPNSKYKVIARIGLVLTMINGFFGMLLVNNALDNLSYISGGESVVQKEELVPPVADNFEKKFECSKLESIIQKKIYFLNVLSQTSGGSNSQIAQEKNILKKVFYSEMYNACLYAYVTENATDYSLYSNVQENFDPEVVPVSRDLYKIANAFTHELIFVDAKGNIWYTDFENKIAELESR